MTSKPTAQRNRRVIAAIAVALTLLVGATTASAKDFDASIGKADRAILTDLYRGRIVHAEPFGGEKNTGAVWKVTVEHNGNYRTAMFKPRMHGDREGWARTPMEVAAYKLNRVLGMDIVPPSAYRRFMQMPGGPMFGEGALMVWVDGVHDANKVADREWNPGREAFSSDMRILQVLLRDADHENGDNVVRGKHWKDGKWRVIKVDNEASLRPEGRVELEYNSATWGEVKRFSARTYKRLKELTFAQLEGDLRDETGPFVSHDEIRFILKKRDHLVAHIDRKTRELGRDRVFFSDAELAYNARLKVGKSSTRTQLRKWLRIMKKKGVTVRFVSPKHALLRGGLAVTRLEAGGKLVVLVAKAKGQLPRFATLVEEQIHVNQLLRMGRRAGSLHKLRTQLRANPKQAATVHASMEMYAKGLVAKTVKHSAKDRTLVKRAELRYHRRTARLLRMKRASRAQTRQVWARMK